MITFGYDCPHCGVKNSGFEVRGKHFHTTENSYGSTLYRFSLMAICNRCKKSIVADTDYLRQSAAEALEQALNDKEWHALEPIWSKFGLKLQFSPRPESPNVSANLPDDVLKKMRTAEKLFIQAKGDEDMLNSAGNAYRATLESALALLDNEADKNLNWRINSLVTSGILVKPMGDFAHRIRALGNEATHADIELSSLAELRLFTQLFLQYTFTLPAMIPKKSDA